MRITNLADRVKWLFRRRSAYRNLFESDDGKRVLVDLCKFCKHFTPTNGSRDEGRRDVYLYLLNILNMDDEMIQKQIQVSKEEL